MNLVQLGEERIDKFGDTLSFVYEGEEFTTIRIDERSRKFAAGLKSLGIGRGDHIVVLLPNSPEIFACFDAIWRIGAVIVPVMFRLGEDETRYILDHSDAKVVITSQDLIEKVLKACDGIDHIRNIIVLNGGSEGDLIDFNNLLDANHPLESFEEMNNNDIALMIYTSGTTGRPKGVMLSHDNLYSNAVATCEATKRDIPDVSILCLPLAHSLGVVAMNAANLSPFEDSYGVLMSWFDPEEVFRLIEKYRATKFTGVPTMFQVMLNHVAADKYDLSSLQQLAVGAAPVTDVLYRAVTSKFGCEMYESYGLTEASPAVAVSRRNMPLKKGSSGVPIPDVEVRIFDSNDNQLPVEEQGEIVVKGPNVMIGYYKRPQETQEALRNGWLHTGDVGYVDEDGYLFITDRIKDLVIKGGYNIYPSEIEGYLEEHPSIAEVAVIGISDEKYGETLMAFVVRVPEADLSELEVIEYATSRITPFKAPSRVKFLNSLPKLPAGKILKKELRKMV